MHHAAGDVTTTHRDRVVQCRASQGGLHAVADRVAHDPAGKDVFDSAEVERALTGSVLGDVRQPELVRVLRGEHVTRAPELVCDHAEVIVDGRTGLATVACALLTEHGPLPVR